MNVIIMKAKDYYGKHATGSVVLIDYRVHFHGSTKEAKEIYNFYKIKDN